jgi:hypothetical protein
VRDSGSERNEDKEGVEEEFDDEEEFEDGIRCFLLSLSAKVSGEFEFVVSEYIELLLPL